MSQSSAALMAIQAYMSFLAWLARYDNRTRIASLLDVSSTGIGYWRVYNLIVISTVLATIDFVTSDGVEAIGLDFISTGSSRMFAVLGGYSVFEAVRIFLRDTKKTGNLAWKQIDNIVKPYNKNSKKILELENGKMTIEDRKEVVRLKDENAELKKKVDEMKMTILNIKKPKIEPAKKKPTIKIGDTVQWSEKNKEFEGIVTAERKGGRFVVKLTTGNNKGRRKYPKKEVLVLKKANMRLKKKSMLQLKF